MFNKVKGDKMKYSKGQTIHRTKKSARELATKCQQENIPYKIVKLKKGYRVDKNWN
jgi:hypothetical protein